MHDPSLSVFNCRCLMSLSLGSTTTNYNRNDDIMRNVFTRNAVFKIGNLPNNQTPNDLPSVKIEELAAQYPVSDLRRVLEVPRSGFYQWRQRVPGPRQKANAKFLQHIQR